MFYFSANGPKMCASFLMQFGLIADLREFRENFSLKSILSMQKNNEVRMKSICRVQKWAFRISPMSISAMRHYARVEKRNIRRL